MEEEIFRVRGYVITTDRVIAPHAGNGEASDEADSWWYRDFRKVTIGRARRTRLLSRGRIIVTVDLGPSGGRAQTTFKSMLRANHFFSMVYAALRRKGLTTDFEIVDETPERIEARVYPPAD